MTSSKKVSVCLPVYNGEEFLAASLESVLGQGYENLELLIADDCSEDGSRTIAAQYAKQDSRVTCLNNESRLGIFANYNNCFKRAQGVFIKPFAQDDVLAPSGLEKLVEALDYHPTATLASGARRIIDGSGKPGNIEKSFFESGVVSGEEVIADYLSTFYNRVGTVCQVLFRKRDIGDGFDTTYAVSGDIDYWLRLLQKGDLSYVADVVCNFRRHPASVTISSMKQMSFMIDTFRLADKHINALMENQKSSTTVYHNAVGGLVRKVAHAIKEREIDFSPKAATTTAGSKIASTNFAPSGNGVNYDYRKMAEHTLLYATEIKTELDEVIHANLRKAAEYERQIEDWSKRAEDLSLELESIKNSKAWKLTEPLRKLRMTVK
jgi:glycosyltransferase involved in cell wall biosynthesis